MVNSKITHQKIALCLSGQPRSFAEAYPYIKKNIIDCNPNVDVFIHCWYDENEVGKKYSHTSDTVREEGQNVVEASIPNRLSELYKPKALTCEPQEDFSNRIRPEYLSARDKTNPFATFSMWTSIQRCNELKKQYELNNNFKYNTVIKARFDLVLFEPFIINTLPKNFVTIGGLSGDYVADILFVTTSDDMNKVSSLVDKLDEYFPVLKKWSNEGFLGHHLKQLGLPTTHRADIQFKLLRGKRTIIDTLWYYCKRLRQKLFS